MNIGILIVTHRQLGHQLLEIASMIFAKELENIACYAVGENHTPEQISTDLHTLRDSLDCSNGLLIMTDLFGATPYNMARELMRETPGCTLVSGINLPMTIKLFNLRHQNCSQLAENLTSNGRMGILIEVADKND